MYKFKQEKIDEIKNKYKISYIADKIGISREYLSYILHNQCNCKKTTAYSITKAIDESKEIDYFFVQL